MAGIAGLTRSHASVHSRLDAAASKPSDAQAVAVARQALNQAQGRVDADHRAHSPACVAVDQKGVDQASSELAGLQSAANAATAGTRALSITA
ncbi:hypothetical protein [Lichenicola sp.]|uniref:hypothetical protein n=1 Tax=Lichenicola sp. TaxID=2804529 RepID=UPI003B00E637